MPRLHLTSVSWTGRGGDVSFKIVRLNWGKSKGSRPFQLNDSSRGFYCPRLRHLQRNYLEAFSKCSLGLINQRASSNVLRFISFEDTSLFVQVIFYSTNLIDFKHRVNVFFKRSWSQSHWIDVSVPTQVACRTHSQMSLMEQLQAFETLQRLFSMNGF